MAAKKYKNREQNQKGSYYTYGNVAHQLQPDYTPDRIREEEKRRKEAARLAKEEAREHRIFSIKMIGVSLVIFIGCIAFMGVNVIVDHAEVSLRKQKSALEDLKASNAILEAELTEQLDMDYIKQEATERLGMSEPQPYQVVYIDVSKQGYTVQYDVNDGAESPSLWDKIKNIFQRE